MVNRGRAVVKKPAGKYKHIWENDDGDEVSPPSSPEHSKLFCIRARRHALIVTRSPIRAAAKAL